MGTSWQGDMNGDITPGDRTIPAERSYKRASLRLRLAVRFFRGLNDLLDRAPRLTTAVVVAVPVVLFVLVLVSVLQRMAG